MANEPHEEINIKYIASSGGCLPIGTVVDLNEEKMAKGMEGFLLDRELLNKVSDSTMSFTVSGTDNCVKEILKLNEMIEIK